LTDPPPVAAAGITLLTMLLLGSGIGAGLGALTGWMAPLVLAGVAVGFAAGIALVYSRYRHL
jgi:energy-converting hydrogenase Eha subunit A